MNLELRLRALVADERLAPLPGADPVARIARLVSQRRRRRWRRVTACAAAFAAVVAAAVTVRLTVLAADSSAESLVPWVDKPMVLLDRVPLPLPTASRACTADDFESFVRGAQPASRGGQETAYEGSVQVTTRRGGTPCVLSGAPQFTGVHDDKRALIPLTVDPKVIVSTESYRPPVLTPGSSATADLVTDTACAGAEKTYRDVRLRIAGQDFQTPVEELGGSCPIRVSPWYAYRPSAGPLDAFEGLRPELEVPTTVRIGETLRYVVTLTNPGPDAVSLDPCPSYVQAVTTEPDSVQPDWAATTHQLNCAPGRIAAGKSLRFEMLLTVPPTQRPGPGRVVWSIANGWGSGGQQTSVVVTLVR